MEGLVDYGVDSDRESNDSPNPENTSVSRNKGNELNIDVPDTTNGNKRDSSSNKGSKSSKSGHSKEVHKSSSSKTNKTSERHHKHHKRSRSRDRDSRSRRRSRSRERKEHHHHDERKKKRRSKSRSRSRSRSLHREEREEPGATNRRDRKPARRTRSQERREKKAATIARMGLDVTNVAASLAMSAENSSAVGSDSSSHNKQNPSTTSGVTSAAVQAAAQQVLQNRVAQAQQVTGVALPSFYNPAAVNPMKYAQQIQKRKLLWSNKEKNEPPATSTAKLWESTAFTQDQDGKMTAKFKRLMGIKHDPSEGAGPSQSVEVAPDSAAEVLKKQQELFASLDQQYQVARATTHTQRGLGLGFSSNPSYPR